jgi:succinoglycan biosynthesis transport protein ExoP
MNQAPCVTGELIRPDINPPAIMAATAPQLVAELSASQPGLLTSVPAAAAAATSPMSVLRALRRRRWLALSVGLIMSGVSGSAAWYFAPSKYKAQARLQVHAEIPKVLFRTIDAEDGGGDAYKRYQTTQLALVKSQMVLSTALALDDHQISKYRMIREQIDPIAWLKEELKVEFVTGSEVMEISLGGENAAEVAGVVNAVTKAYMDEVVNKDVKRRKDRLDVLEKLSKHYGEMLGEQAKARRALAQKLGSDDRNALSLRHQYAEDQLERVKAEYFDALSRKRKAEAVFKAVRAREDPAPAATSASEEAIDRMVEEDPAVSDLATRLAEAENRLHSQANNIRAVARKGIRDYSLHPLQDEVRSLRRELADCRKEVRPRVIEEFQNRLEGKASGGESAKYLDAAQEVQVCTELEQSLREEVDKLTNGREQLTTKTLQLQDIQDDLASIQDAAKKVATEVESLKVELGAPSRIHQIEEAMVPLTKDDKKRLAIIGMAIFGSFFGGLFGIALLELQTRKVDCADEVPTDLGLRVVGGLPILPSRPSRERSLAIKGKDRYGYDLLLESVDATRTMLVHAARGESHRIVMITSAVSGEGKSSLASYLAPSLARSGMKTLLVDADLRNPSLHQIFEFPLTPGLSELLRGETSLSAVIRQTAIEHLSLVPAGVCDRQTIHLLAQGRLGAHFSHFKEQFDFIIVDSSPVLPIADALIVAQQVDAVLFSIFRDVSRKTRVSAALQRLQCLRVPVLGAVVTGAEGSRYGNQYGYGSTYPSVPESDLGSTEQT